MTALTILFAILMFSVIIFVHELGHFIAARIFRVTVHEFSVGMGPAIFQKKGKSGTTYSIRIVPIGGFCQMEGEDEESENEGSFSSKPKFARFVILASGAFMNVVLGFIISLIVVLMTMKGGIVTTTLKEAAPNSPIAEYVMPGDKIIEINGRSTNIFQEISTALSLSESDSFDIKVKRDGEILSFENVKFHITTEDGVKYKTFGVDFKVDKPTVWGVVREGYFEGIYMGKVVFLSLKMLIGGKASFKDLSGPVGVVSQMENVASSSGGGLLGFINLLYLAGFISINIGIMNLLPLPALDGGRLFFILIELIIRRKIPPEKEGIVHFIGLVLLFALMIFVTWNDIMRLIN